MNKPTILLMVPLLACVATLACCFSTIAQDSVRTYFQHKSEEQIYRERLGIGNSDKEVETFITEALQGLTHPEALETLGQWGDVEEGDCSFGPESGRCTVYVHNFLGTKRGYEFTIFYRGSKVDSAAIYHS